MFGRYFSSHKGDILVMPSPPQRGNWKRPSRVETLRQCLPKTHPAPRACSRCRRRCPSGPGRAVPGFRPASASANWAAATPIWHSRHITFRPLRMAFFCSFSSGPKSSISPVNCRAAAPKRAGRAGSAAVSAASCGQDARAPNSSGPTPLRPCESASHSDFLGAAQWADEPHSGDDHSSRGRCHTITMYFVPGLNRPFYRDSLPASRAACSD